MQEYVKDRVEWRAKVMGWMLMRPQFGLSIAPLGPYALSFVQDKNLSCLEFECGRVTQKH